MPAEGNTQDVSCWQSSIHVKLATLAADFPKNVKISVAKIVIFVSNCHCNVMYCRRLYDRKEIDTSVCQVASQLESHSYSVVGCLSTVALHLFRCQLLANMFTPAFTPRGTILQKKVVNLKYVICDFHKVIRFKTASG